MHFSLACFFCILPYLSIVSSEANATNPTLDPDLKGTEVLTFKGRVKANITPKPTYRPMFGSTKDGHENRSVRELFKPTLDVSFTKVTLTTPKVKKSKKPTKSKKRKKPKKSRKRKKTAKPEAGVTNFEEPTEPPRLLPPKCWEEASCAGRCSYKRDFQDVRSFRNPSCFCDPLCDSVFQDCCADYDQQCNATLIRRKFPESELDSRWECLDVPRRIDKIWMIGSCRPDLTKDEVSKKCTDDHARDLSRISGQIPVIDKNNITFRNRYCALCNGVKDFKPWKFDVDCDVIPPSNYTELEWVTFLDHFCSRNSLMLHSNNQAIRHCYQIVTKCRYEDDKDAVEKCKTGPTGLVSLLRYLNFRNMDCLRCNFITTDEFSTVNCGPELPLRLPDMRLIPSFSAIFSGSEFRSSERVPQCPDGHLFDKLSQVCHKLLGKQDLNLGKVLKKYAITLQYEQENDSCSFSLQIAGPKENRLRFKFVFENLLEISLIERGWQFTDLEIQILGNSSYLATFQIFGLRQDSKTHTDSPLQYPKIDSIVFHSTFVDDEIYGICRYSLGKIVVREMFCLENRTFSVNKDDFSENRTIFIEATRQYYSRGQYLVYNQQNETRLAVCKDFQPANCSYYHTVENRTRWKLFPNRSVYSNTTASWFHYGQYSITDGTLSLCLSKDLLANSDTTRSSPTSIHHVILSFATLFTLTISIMSLVVLLIVYSIFPPLRNLPGENLMVLCAILALGQLLWLLQSLVASWSRAVCKAVAVALQYFVVSLFSCSGSIAFHSYITFRAIAKGKLCHSAPGKAFPWYAMYSLGFPFIVVAVCCVLDHYKVVSIGYAARPGSCWIEGTTGLYVAFIGPMYSLLFINFVLLFATVKVIQKCTKISKDLVVKSAGTNKKHIVIYLRMSTMMGFTWLFGVFLIIFPDLLVFQYLFVFVNGLQGFYIALAFLLTDSVKKMCSRRLTRTKFTSTTLSSSGTKCVR